MDLATAAAVAGIVSAIAALLSLVGSSRNRRQKRRGVATTETDPRAKARSTVRGDLEVLQQGIMGMEDTKSLIVKIDHLLDGVSNLVTLYADVDPDLAQKIREDEQRLRLFKLRIADMAAASRTEMAEVIDHIATHVLGDHKDS